MTVSYFRTDICVVLCCHFLSASAMLQASDHIRYLVNARFEHRPSAHEIIPATFLQALTQLFNETPNQLNSTTQSKV